MPIMDEEDARASLLKENAALKARIKELEEKNLKYMNQIDNDRLKIEEIQQMLFRLQSIT